MVATIEGFHCNGCVLSIGNVYECIAFSTTCLMLSIYVLYRCVLWFIYRLLDLLADRKEKAGKSGKVLIDGQKRQANYKTVVGYVVQVYTYLM